jgi:hypothetical protein
VSKPASPSPFKEKKVSFLKSERTPAAKTRQDTSSEYVNFMATELRSPSKLINAHGSNSSRYHESNSEE